MSKTLIAELLLASCDAPHIDHCTQRAVFENCVQAVPPERLTYALRGAP